jgi:hypothetical protein
MGYTDNRFGRFAATADADGPRAPTSLPLAHLNLANPPRAPLPINDAPLKNGTFTILLLCYIFILFSSRFSRLRLLNGLDIIIVSYGRARTL